MAAAFIMVLVALPHPAMVFGIDPIASWSMDDGSGNSVTDSIGKYAGTLRGASWTPAAVVIDPSGYAWDLGSSSKGSPWALDFNGKDNYVEVPDAQALRSENFSVAFWVAPDTSSDWANLMGKQYYVTGQLAGWMISWDSGGPSSPRLIRMTVYAPSHQGFSSTGVNVTLGGWSHLAFTYENNSIAAYKNGRLIGTTTTGGFLPTTEPFRVGRAYGDSHYFDGLIDDILFYNGSLTEGDVRQLYESYNSTAQRFTVIEMRQVSAILGQETVISARLLDQRGSILAGAKVSFRLDGQVLGQAVTDSRGFASIRYTFRGSGAHSLTGEFSGIGSYAGGAQTINIVVSQEQFPQQYLLFGGVGAALVVGLVLFRRRRGAGNVEWDRDIEGLLEGRRSL